MYKKAVPCKIVKLYQCYFLGIVLKYNLLKYYHVIYIVKKNINLYFFLFTPYFS